MTITGAVAGAVIFPRCLAEKSYAEIVQVRHTGAKTNKIKSIAARYLISPITVYPEINRYAEKKDYPKLNLTSIFAAAKYSRKQYYSVIEYLFKNKYPEAEDIIAVTTEWRRPFFSTLKAYMANENKAANHIQSILNIPFAGCKRNIPIIKIKLNSASKKQS